MTRNGLGLVWCRLRATLRRRWRGHVPINAALAQNPNFAGVGALVLANLAAALPGAAAARTPTAAVLHAE